ncbi:MAG: helix-turn-helix domain-containing protein [Methylobacter sp.]|jgi:sugar-specific transcriptional regulator TrmB
MPRIDEILKAFSLTDIEAKVYLSALSLEKPAVAQIAKKVGLNRTAAYHHINHLLEKGFLKQTRKGRVVQLVAVPPAELAERFDRITTDFKSMVPQLESLQKISRETPIIEITESRRGYSQIYGEISSMPEGSTFRVLEGAQAWQKELQLQSEKDLNAFFSRVIERKIVTRGIFTQEVFEIINKGLSKTNRSVFEKRIWQLKSLPTAMLPFQQLMFIYGDKTVFVFPNSSLVMSIKHKDIAEIMLAMFEGLFNFAKNVTF